MALGTNIEYKAKALFQAALDEKSAKQVEDRFVKLSKEASEISREEFVAAFSSLGQEINNALSKLKLPTIDMEKLIKLPQVEAFNQLGAEFGTRFAEGFQGAVAGSMDIISQIAALEARKTELNQQAQKLDKRYTKYERLSEVSSMDYSEFKPLNAEDNLDEQAQRIMGEFVQAEDALNELQRGTKEYNSALVKALEAAEKLYRMAQTLNQNKGAVKDETLLSDYSMLNLSDTTADVFDKADEDFNKYFRGFDKYYREQNKAITAEIQNIDAQMATLRENPEIINEAKAQSALKTLQEIEAAYERLSYKTGQNKGQLKNPEQISSALNYVPGTESLAKLKNAYTKAEPERWEQQYVALVKFVREYEAYLNMMNAETDSHQRSKMKDRLGQYTELYQQLQPMAANAENMLQNILNKANKVPLVGMSGVGADIISKSGSKVENDATPEDLSEQNQLVQQYNVNKEKTLALLKKEQLSYEEILYLIKEVQAEYAKSFYSNKNYDLGDDASSLMTSVYGKLRRGDMIDPRLDQAINGVGMSAEDGAKILSDYQNKQMGVTPEEVENANKLAEAEAKARAEAEAKANAEEKAAAAAAKAKAENEAAAAAAEKERLAQEAAAKAAREKAEARRAELSTKLFEPKKEDLDGDYYDTEALENIIAQNQEVLSQLANEDLLTEEIRTKYEAINKTIAERIAYQNEYYAAEQAAEKSLDSLYDIDDKIDATDNPDEANALLEERKRILSEISPLVREQYEETIAEETKVNSLIEKRIALLREAQSGRIDVDDVDDIMKERGDLESKLDRLQEVSGDWGSNIKDSEVGDDEYALESLQLFEETYDRIVLKLANGKNIEILPNAKGLRALYKYYNGLGPDVYGETEIEDIEFVRRESQVHQDNTTAINTETQAQDKLNQAKVREKQIKQSDNDGAEVAEENAKTEAIKQQNGALQENINLKAQANGQDVTTPGIGQATILTQTVPDGTTSSEVTELEAVRAKVLEVTNAINLKNKAFHNEGQIVGQVVGKENAALISLKSHIESVTGAAQTKTQAFFNEQSAVKRVAQSEISALGGVEQKVTAVRVALNNLQTKQTKINVSVAGTEDLSGISSEEMEALKKLRAALQLTTKRVNEKTQAFETEKTVVNKVVTSEVNALNRLNGQVNTVNQTIMTLLQNIQNVQTGASNIVVPQAQPAPQGNTGAQGQGSSGGRNSSPQLLNAKIDTQFSSLSLMYAQLESVGKLTPQIEQQWLQLWDSLSKVNDTSSLQLWREQLNQVKNSMKEIMIANNLVEQEGVQSFQQLMAITKLYNKMLIGAAKAKTPEEKSVYEQEANNALIEQQRILQGITLTKEQQAKFDELEIERTRQINLIQAQQTGRQKQIHDTQVEAEIIRRLIELYEQLGRAQFLGNAQGAAAIRQQIGAERANLSSVDYATDMKFQHAKDKGYNAEQTKAENVALKEQEGIINRLNTLYQEYGVLVERASATSGTNLGAQIADEAAAKLAEIQTLMASLKGGVTPELQQGFDEAFDRGKAIESAKQYEAIAKRADQDEATRLKNIANLEKEIGKLRAEVDSTTNTEVKNALEQEIQLRKDLIALQQQGLAMDAQDEAYYRQLYALRTKQAKSGINQDRRDQATIFKEEIKEAQRQAGLSKSKSAESKAVETLVSASQIQGITPEQQANLNAYQSKILELRNTIASFPKDGVASEVQKNQLIAQRLEVDAYTKEIQELIANYERLSGENAQVLGTSTLGLGASTDAYQQELTQTIMAQTKGRAQIKAYDAETRTLTYTLKTGRGEFTQYAASVRQADGALVSVRGTTTKAMGVFESIGKKIKEYSYYFTGSMMIYRVIAWVREGITAVTEIDKALTELKKVTDETEASYDRFLNTASKTSERIGTTIADFTQATATFAKLGYDMTTASAMAEAATVYQNVGDGIESADAAAESIISTIKGFNLEASESMRIVDRFNEVGNRFSVTSKGIGDALQRSASALSSAGNTLDESIGLITAANEVVNLCHVAIVI